MPARGRPWPSRYHHAWKGLSMRRLAGACAPFEHAIGAQRALKRHGRHRSLQSASNSQRAVDQLRFSAATALHRKGSRSQSRQSRAQLRAALPCVPAPPHANRRRLRARRASAARKRTRLPRGNSCVSLSDSTRPPSATATSLPGRTAGWSARGSRIRCRAPTERDGAAGGAVGAAA